MYSSMRSIRCAPALRRHTGTGLTLCWIVPSLPTCGSTLSRHTAEGVAILRILIFISSPASLGSNSGVSRTANASSPEQPLPPATLRTDPTYPTIGVYTKTRGDFTLEITADRAGPEPMMAVSMIHKTEGVVFLEVIDKWWLRLFASLFQGSPIGSCKKS